MVLLAIQVASSFRLRHLKHFKSRLNFVNTTLILQQWLVVWIVFHSKLLNLQGYVFDNLEVDENGAARVVLTRKVLDEFNVTDAESSAIVGTPGRIDCVESWAIFVEQPEGHYRVRLRSKSIVINEIAKRHDGGGHPLASGANSYSLDENEQIYQEIKDTVAHATH